MAILKVLNSMSQQSEQKAAENTCAAGRRGAAEIMGPHALGRKEAGGPGVSCSEAQPCPDVLPQK